MRVKKENIHFTKTQSTLKLSKNTVIVVKSIMNGIVKFKSSKKKIENTPKTPQQSHKKV